MNTQSLNEATKLYEIIGKYVPDVLPEDLLDYVNEILENIKQSGNYDAYLDALQLMTGKTQEDIVKLHSEDILNLFIKSLMEWHIIELAAFFRNIGYKL